MEIESLELTVIVAGNLASINVSYEASSSEASIQAVGPRRRRSAVSALCQSELGNTCHHNEGRHRWFIHNPSTNVYLKIPLLVSNRVPGERVLRAVSFITNMRPYLSRSTSSLLPYYLRTIFFQLATCLAFQVISRQNFFF